MLTDKKLSWSLLLAAVLLAGPAMGQGLGNSPYSRLGLGDNASNTGGVRQLGMGGVGLAAPNSGNVNELNPALLYYTPRTTWEAGFNGQIKSVRNADVSHTTGTGTLAYLALAIPINKHWAAAVGLKPYSAVDYNATTTGPVNGDPQATAIKQYKGTGGLSEAYFASGFHVLRDLNLGGSASYFFGTIDQTTGTAITTPTLTAQQLVVNDQSLHFSDFLFRAAAHYRHKVGKDLNLNLAGVHTFQTNAHTTRLFTTQRQDANGAIIGTSTTLADDAGYTLVPALTQAGISFDNNRTWSVSADVSQQHWSNYTPLKPLTNIVTDNSIPLHDTWRAAAGGEFTPDPGSVEHYFQRVTYRLGLSVSKMPYEPTPGQHLYDRAVHAGVSFPLPTASALESTTISLALLYGIRGNTDYLYGNGGVSNVRENYLRIQAAATLSNRWFIKRRLQ